MLKKIILIILFALVPTGIYGADQDVDEAQPASTNVELLIPDEGYGLIYVVRGLGKRPNIQWDVFLNESEGKDRKGYTSGGQYIYFQAPPGQHTFISRGVSDAKTIRVDIKAGETVFIRQKEKSVYRRGGSSQDDLEILTPEVGKYMLERTSKGWIESENPRGK